MYRDVGVWQRQQEWEYRTGKGREIELRQRIQGMLPSGVSLGTQTTLKGGPHAQQQMVNTNECKSILEVFPSYALLGLTDLLLRCYGFQFCFAGFYTCANVCLKEFICVSCGFFVPPHLFCPILVLIFLDACCILMGERKKGCEFGWAGKERRILEELGDGK